MAQDKIITIIKPTRGLRFVDLEELASYRDLLYFLVIRGIKAKYAQSVLGVGWAIIQPLFSTVVFTIVFGNLAQVSSDGAPYFLFSLAAMIPWQYFANTLTDATNSLVANANMISKVYFPRLILPLSAAFARLIDFLIGFIVLIIFLFVYEIPVTWDVVFLPFLVILLLMSSLGIGMFLSAIAVQYRDVKYAMSFLMQLLMYAAPVVYPMSKVPEQYQFLYSLNPMVGVIEGFRSALLHTNEMPWDSIITSAIVSTILFVCGALYFKVMERFFADIV